MSHYKWKYFGKFHLKIRYYLLLKHLFTVYCLSNVKIAPMKCVCHFDPISESFSKWYVRFGDSHQTYVRTFMGFYVKVIVCVDAQTHSQIFFCFPHCCHIIICYTHWIVLFFNFAVDKWWFQRWFCFDASFIHSLRFVKTFTSLSIFSENHSISELNGFSFFPPLFNCILLCVISGHIMPINCTNFQKVREMFR